LYSAVLTAFIIESMKLLEEDPTETTRDILLVISQQIANNSLPPYQSVKYETPRYAVVINSLFFASLSCGLIVALVAVLALQWVANYDIGLNTSSPRKRALQRQLRWTGILKWKMAEIIAFLPLLVFVSLFLFFIGIADWLWHMNRTISGIVIGGVGIGFLLYAITTLISVIAIEAPFRTPVSRSLSLLVRDIKDLLVHFFGMTIQRKIIDRTPWFRIQYFWNVHLGRKSTLVKSFLKREDLMANKKEVSKECLLWLANSIEISSNSQVQLMALVRELVEVPAELLIQEEGIIDAPWKQIFTTLSSPYINRPVDEWTGDEMQLIVDICKGMSVVPSAFYYSRLEVFISSVNRLGNPLASTISSLALAQNSYDRELHFNAALTHAAKPNVVAELGENYLHFFLLTLQSKWHVIPTRGGHRQRILEYIGQLCAIPTEEVRNITPIPRFPIPSLKVILNLVVHMESFGARIPTNQRIRTLGDRYINVARKLMEGGLKGTIHLVHRGIQRQILAQISRVDFSSRSADHDLKALVELLLQISLCKTLAMNREDRHSFVFIITRIGIKSDPSVVDWLWNGLRVMHDEDEGLEDQFVAFTAELDDYLTSERELTEKDYDYLSKVVASLDWRPGSTTTYDALNFWKYKASPWDKLPQIRDPCLAWWLLQWSPNDWQFQSLIQPNFNLLEDRTDSLSFPVGRWGYESIPDSAVIFVRTLVIDGSPKMQELAMRILANHMEPLYGRNNPLMSIVSHSFPLVPSRYCSLYTDVAILLCTRVGQAI
jgi:hypothetical protein